MFLFRIRVSHLDAAVVNMHARIIRRLIVLVVAFHRLSLPINDWFVIISFLLISFVPSPSACIDEPIY